MKKEIIFITSQYNGGAARVLSILSDTIKSEDYSISFIFTSDQKDKAVIKLPDHPIFYLHDNIKGAFRIKKRLLRYISKFLSFISKDYGIILKYYSRNYNLIYSLKKYLSKKQNATLIAFLNEPIFLTLLSAHKSQRVIISERNDPSMFTGTKTTMAFINKLYPKAYRMVCQSPDAENWYKENTNASTTVIYNPIKQNLPFASDYTKNTIVNFCRISRQKNLELLIEAFAIFQKKHNEYTLLIAGNASGAEEENYLNKLINLLCQKNLKDAIQIIPGNPEIHSQIKDCAMFVSSSDFEGMSNSMLEAMAMGMPVICTDCPAGGARAVIRDGENGLLVPVGDAKSMADAMCRYAEDPEFAKHMGENAKKIRTELSPEKITEQWEKLF